ncbi:hypothetical protein M0222_14985 [Myxococcus fulvus]|nr:hypothetical protein [Myxococcus fulvus]
MSSSFVVSVEARVAPCQMLSRPTRRRAWRATTRGATQKVRVVSAVLRERASTTEAKSLVSAVPSFGLASGMTIPPSLTR